MAPRTKEQQAAYNAKRRAETAAKKSVPVVDVPKPKPEPTREASRERLAGKVNAERKAEAKAMLTKPGRKAKAKGFRLKPGGKTKVQVAPKPNVKPLTGPPAAMVDKPVHTMEKSYLRNGAPGGGMQRGKNFQSTVTFTPEQFAELRDKALFNQRSLAEQIRWCVIQQLRSSQ